MMKRRVRLSANTAKPLTAAWMLVISLLWGGMQAAKAEDYQIISLEPGWNWVAFYVLPEDRSVGSVLTNIPDSGAHQIKCADWFATYQDGQWYGGDGQQIEYGWLYKIFFDGHNSSAFAVEGLRSDWAGSVDFVSGWNWLGYSYAYAQPMTSALAAIAFSPGDQFVSATHTAMYDGIVWSPGDIMFLPGSGFKLTSSVVTNVTIAPPPDPDMDGVLYVEYHDDPESPVLASGISGGGRFSVHLAATSNQTLLVMADALEDFGAVLAFATNGYPQQFVFSDGSALSFAWEDAGDGGGMRALATLMDPGGSVVIDNIPWQPTNATSLARPTGADRDNIFTRNTFDWITDVAQLGLTLGDLLVNRSKTFILGVAQFTSAIARRAVPESNINKQDIENLSSGLSAATCAVALKAAFTGPLGWLVAAGAAVNCAQPIYTIINGNDTIGESKIMELRAQFMAVEEAHYDEFLLFLQLCGGVYFAPCRSGDVGIYRVVRESSTLNLVISRMKSIHVEKMLSFRKLVEAYSLSSPEGWDIGFSVWQEISQYLKPYDDSSGLPMYASEFIDIEYSLSAINTTRSFLITTSPVCCEIEDITLACCYCYRAEINSLDRNNNELDLHLNLIQRYSEYRGDNVAMWVSLLDLYYSWQPLGYLDN